MFLGHRVILPLDHFLGHGAGVFLGDIEVARVSGADQTNLDCCCLGHFDFSVFWDQISANKLSALYSDPDFP